VPPPPPPASMAFIRNSTFDRRTWVTFKLENYPLEVFNNITFAESVQDWLIGTFGGNVTIQHYGSYASYPQYLILSDQVQELLRRRSESLSHRSSSVADATGAWMAYRTERRGGGVTLRLYVPGNIATWSETEVRFYQINEATGNIGFQFTMKANGMYYGNETTVTVTSVTTIPGTAEPPVEELAGEIDVASEPEWEIILPTVGISLGACICAILCFFWYKHIATTETVFYSAPDPYIQRKWQVDDIPTQQKSIHGKALEVDGKVAQYINAKCAAESEREMMMVKTQGPTKHEEPLDEVGIEFDEDEEDDVVDESNDANEDAHALANNSPIEGHKNDDDTTPCVSFWEGAFSA